MPPIKNPKSKIQNRPRRGHLLTEQRNPRSQAIDACSMREILEILNAEDRTVADAIATVIPAIERAVELVTAALRQGGRLFYVGAGTSGRLGVLDAAECPPTFGTDPSLVQGVIAGGLGALTRSVEGAEDSPEAGARALDERQVSSRDVVMGIAAGSTTPYVLGALRHARAIGCRTLFLTCIPAENVPVAVDVLINPLTGPEVITGSTRLKAGTATKLVLNMLTTATMIRLGKVYGNLMVDLRAVNAKLVDRACRIIGTLTNLDYDSAGRLLAEAGGEVKVALVMHLASVTAAEARQRLAAANGYLRRALEPAHTPISPNPKPKS